MERTAHPVFQSVIVCLLLFAANPESAVSALDDSHKSDLRGIIQKAHQELRLEPNEEYIKGFLSGLVELDVPTHHLDILHPFLHRYIQSLTIDSCGILDYETGKYHSYSVVHVFTLRTLSGKILSEKEALPIKKNLEDFKTAYTQLITQLPLRHLNDESHLHTFFLDPILECVERDQRALTDPTYVGCIESFTKEKKDNVIAEMKTKADTLFNPDFSLYDLRDKFPYYSGTLSGGDRDGSSQFAREFTLHLMLRDIYQSHLFDQAATQPETTKSYFESQKGRIITHTLNALREKQQIKIDQKFQNSPNGEIEFKKKMESLIHEGMEN